MLPHHLIPHHHRQRVVQLVNRPLLWAGGAGLVLLAVAVGQYARHPEWLGPFQRAEVGPSGIQRGDLTPEEEASLADIDTLSLLQDQIPSSAEGTAAGPVNGADVATDAPALLSLQDLLAADGPASGPVSSPFADYLERVRFDRPAPASPALPGPAPETTARNSFLRDEVVPTAPPASEPSALQGALDRQFSSPSSPSQSAPTADREVASSPEPGAEADAATPSSTTAAPSPFTPGLVQGTLPSTGQTFVQTLPQMSPPPGTTGYTVPSGLGPLPTAPSLALPPGSPVVPDLGPARLGIPGPGQLGTSSGPSGLGVAPSALDGGVPATSEVSPFAVPRPPGSYTGGGFIYTFSDPNGPAP